MQRSGPLKRFKELATKTPLRAKKWWRPKRKNTGPSAKIRGLLLERSGGRCEFPACPEWATEPHHRYGRKNGGSSKPWINNLCNLVAACRHHNEWVEREPKKAAEIGMYLRGKQVPWLWPVRIRGLGWVLLDDRGGAHPAADTHAALLEMEAGDGRP